MNTRWQDCFLYFQAMSQVSNVALGPFVLHNLCFMVDSTATKSFSDKWGWGKIYTILFKDINYEKIMVINLNNLGFIIEYQYYNNSHLNCK